MDKLVYLMMLFITIQFIVMNDASYDGDAIITRPTSFNIQSWLNPKPQNQIGLNCSRVFCRPGGFNLNLIFEQ